MKTEREMFVKKYREVFKVDKSLFVNDNGEFIDEFCQSVYEIWQARVPEGYVVVPVDKLMDCLYQISDRSYVDNNVSEIKAMIEAVEK